MNYTIRYKSLMKAWAYIRKDIESSDPEVTDKKVPFLSRLYHAINRTFSEIVEKAEKGTIDPFVKLKSMKYGEKMGSFQFHDINRPIRAGFLPIGGNPLWWGHILIALMSMNALDLDTIVFRVQGEIRYKALPETDCVPVKDRHDIVKTIIKKFFPLLRYTDLGSEPGNEREGSDEIHCYLELNPDTLLHIYYLVGVENKERVERYFKQQYEAAKKHNFGVNPNHKITIGWIQRGEYGAKITQEELDYRSERIRKRIGYGRIIKSVLIKDPDIDLQVSSTYYRNTHDLAIVPRVIDKHAKDHGYYGHPPIDPRTGKPYDFSEEEYFKYKLRPIAEGIANQTVRAIEKKSGDKLAVLSLDGGSGSGKTTVMEEVGKFLKLRGYEPILIGLDLLLKDRKWRMAVQKLLVGEPLGAGDKELVAEIAQYIQPGKEYLEEETFFDHKLILAILQEIDEFRKSDEKTHTLHISNAYNQKTKGRENHQFALSKNAVILIDGKYANRKELLPYYDLCYRLNDNPDRTKAKFEMRTRTLSPNDADRQMIFYDLALVPSFKAYEKRTKDNIDYVVDLSGDNWELRDGLSKIEELFAKAVE